MPSEPNRIMTELEAGNHVYDLYGKANVNNNPDAAITVNQEDIQTPYVFDWIGTTTEYQQQDIENQHPEWVCFITDDVEGGLNVYTKSESDDKFVIKSGDVEETVNGQKTFSALTKHNKEVVVTTASPYGQFRAIGGNYGFIVRNDGSNTYFLLTALIIAFCPSTDLSITTLSPLIDLTIHVLPVTHAGIDLPS